MTPGTDWIDQAQRLVEALRGGLASVTDAAHTDDPAAGAHSADCRWCPICQAAAVVRGERPEVNEALADLLTAAATALRTVAATGRPAEPEAETRQEDEPPAPVQQIDIA
ncbi:hypothetical protein [Blastococcus brunescens]|uniref:Uncharacterized protein n=1 Tax=Blastococcus brunescens TaxID=1564165 RepID=A0ABZ1B868_9ACTN|nr:hypothetical protein [Blastococcus sp. BMG 8361]WRL66003.1 hypothetical protein U6N30_10900 [Blastococcus sp. BMG 8361]